MVCTIFSSLYSIFEGRRYFGRVLFLIILIMSSKVVTASLSVFLPVSKITKSSEEILLEYSTNVITGPKS